MEDVERFFDYRYFQRNLNQRICFSQKVHFSFVASKFNYPFSILYRIEFDYKAAIAELEKRCNFTGYDRVYDIFLSFFQEGISGKLLAAKRVGGSATSS